MPSAKYDDGDGRLRGSAGVKRRLRLWSVNPYCVKCGRLTDYPKGFNLDHKVPLHKGGPDTDENLQTLCLPCHESKTNEDLGRRERVQIDVTGWPTNG